ncbi:MAG TPA: methyltransferase [Dissulfurispiraceae bacterium]
MQALAEVKELRKLWGGFWSSRVLLTANNFRVFDHLKAPAAAIEIARKLKIDRRAAEILLDALTGLGLLKKSAGKYRNTPASNRFLVKGTPLYQGDIIKHADILWQNWSELDATVKTGKPSRRARDHSSFILGMHNIASLKAPDVLGTLDLKGVKRALDLGGGPGTYSMELAKKGIAVTLFDMPETVKIAKGVVGKSGLKNIDFIRGDFTVDDIGKGYDLIFISQILHAFSVKDSIRLLRKCRAALNPGGRIAIQEFYLAKDRTHPVPSALFSVNMLVNTPGGRCYAPSEIKQWLTQTGFSVMKEKMLDDTVLVMGRTK